MRFVMVNQTKEMIKQTELRIKPLITVHLKKDTRDLFINNVGNGTAMNINIADVDVDIFDNEGKSKLRFVFETISSMVSGENKEMNNYEAYKPDNTEIPIPKSRDIAKLGEYCKEQTLPFNITYENLLRRKYSSKVQCSKEGCKIIKLNKD